ncbi:MAG: sodium/proline symporter [Myxococcales bacterium]|nr:sodium/proline symporter [Myxococcales bacterium]
MAAAVFVLALIAFTAIGVASSRVKQPTTDDYLLAGRNVPAWLTALSSVATNNSGFMFVGLIGFAYAAGVQAVWLQLGWIVGDWFCWLRFHRRIRERTGDLGLSSVPALAGTNEDGGRDRVVAGVAAILTFVFLAGYAAAQLNAGSTALHALFGWDLRVGALLGAAVVVLYSFSGGIRASIWTDAAQSFVMLFAMAALLVAAAMKIPPSELLGALREADPALVRWWPRDLPFGFGLPTSWASSSAASACSDSRTSSCAREPRLAESIPRARWIYFAWFVPFSVAAVLVGLYARLLIPELPAVEHGNAAELAMPELAVQLLPDALVGVALAGLFAATISTADSQLLACSAAVTQDLFPRWRSSYAAAKLATLTVGALALGVALHASDGVFSLVLMSWSALGAGLGPLLVVRLAGRPIARATAIAMMAAGVGTVFGWSALGLSGAVFELLPGMAAAFLAYGMMPLFIRPVRFAPPTTAAMTGAGAATGATTGAGAATAAATGAGAATTTATGAGVATGATTGAAGAATAAATGAGTGAGTGAATAAATGTAAAPEGPAE